MPRVSVRPELTLPTGGPEGVGVGVAEGGGVFEVTGGVVEPAPDTTRLCVVDPAPSARRKASRAP